MVWEESRVSSCCYSGPLTPDVTCYRLTDTRHCDAVETTLTADWSSLNWHVKRDVNIMGFIFYGKFSTKSWVVVVDGGTGWWCGCRRPGGGSPTPGWWRQRLALLTLNDGWGLSGARWGHLSLSLMEKLYVLNLPHIKISSWILISLSLSLLWGSCTCKTSLRSKSRPEYSLSLSRSERERRWVGVGEVGRGCDVVVLLALLTTWTAARVCGGVCVCVSVF